MQRQAKSPLELTAFKRLHFELSLERPVCMSEATYTSRQDTLFDMHYELEIGIVRQGAMRREYSDWTDEYGAGDVWVCGMWEPHGFTIAEAPCDALAMVVLPEMLVEASRGGYDWLAPFGVSPKMRARIPPRHRERVLRIATDLHDNAQRGEPQRGEWQRVLVFELLLALCDGWQMVSHDAGALSVRTYQRIEPAVRAVFEAKAFVSGEAAAKLCGMSRNAFSSLFASTMGISFAAFALRYRLNGAARQLTQTDLPLKAVASEWGFTDVSHLHKCFMEFGGMSPGRYRKAGATR
jgi:AraC-like DNA-binding protein